ncbi:hypothetical protein Pla110_44060 [Polystyrenella longa]|uniref:Uncharacterized protein n=1 Tax=Polystyrenella longa TaxID=2528007 RepID=A0A518CTV6_9PLAN|nr:hypothetical protein [Polystyrenella longa]QDU82645.1 hypothetical protein Pla110_44060 [Polystyrenella longa]
MVQLNIKKPVSVEAKTLKVHLKVRDEMGFSIEDQDGKEIFDREDGYVPDFFPGEHYGDYLILDIDIDTGKITNWEVPSADDLQKLINGDDDDDE